MEKTVEEKQRLNVWIDPELIKKLKSKAALQGQTLSDFVEESLKKLVKE
jgi:predicted HicB family RNase H-like nuclease